MEIRKRELIVITLFVLGSIVDHTTTYYGLKLPSIVESYPLVIQMIGAGIWNIFEIALILTGVGSAFVILRENSGELVSLSMAGLGSVGVIRMYAGVLNIALWIIHKVYFAFTLIVHTCPQTGEKQTNASSEEENSY